MIQSCGQNDDATSRNCLQFARRCHRYHDDVRRRQPEALVEYALPEDRWADFSVDTWAESCKKVQGIFLWYSNRPCPADNRLYRRKCFAAVEWWRGLTAGCSYRVRPGAGRARHAVQVFAALSGCGRRQNLCHCPDGTGTALHPGVCEQC